MLVRLLARDDLEQVKKAENFIGKGAWVSTLVLAESFWVLQSVYKLNTEKVILAMQMLLDHTQLVLQDADLVQNALAKFITNAKVGFMDYLILETAKKAGHSPLGSFDKAFAKIQGVSKL